MFNTLMMTSTNKGLKVSSLAELALTEQCYKVISTAEDVEDVEKKML